MPLLIGAVYLPLAANLPLVRLALKVVPLVSTAVGVQCAFYVIVPLTCPLLFVNAIFPHERFFATQAFRWEVVPL